MLFMWAKVGILMRVNRALFEVSSRIEERKKL